MEKTIAQFKDGNVEILVETAEQTSEQGGMGAAGIGDTLKKYILKPVADTTFKGAMGIVSYASNTILEEIKEIKEQPESVEVEFGIKLTGEGKAMIASGGVEANYKVKLSWKKLDNNKSE
ncbi:CU044_2847 family protein [Candidatus Venteria ishoeyi]|uniref:Trypsin-co-occurring domain-containing protein n=1 Tax=Candidatus Venteria ishoeyi TaxID=1899563 RepID=A0A1H6F323_9GAMM|nr:CU044_2847 family protein [Candidatus Venteria ishoeyi]SEH04520.1 Uncharacterised protein [Candidatus Venteria ishoeyi]